MSPKKGTILIGRYIWNNHCVSGDIRSFSRKYTLEEWRLEPTNHLERKMVWTKPPGNYVPAINLQLVGFNPFETYARQNGFIFPMFVVKIFWKIFEKNHHPVVFWVFLWFTYVASGIFCSPNPRHRGHKTPRVRSRATDLPHRDFHQPPNRWRLDIRSVLDRLLNSRKGSSVL